jgi:hypothetical protein
MANGSFGDAARDQLRVLVAKVDGDILQLPRGDGANAALHASWSELVKALALGPAPELRECPVCHGSGFRAASRCSNCWTKLEALPEPHASTASTSSLAAAAAITTPGSQS